MEEDGEQTPRTPFWIQSTTNLRRGDLYRRRVSALFLNSGVLIILLLLFAILSMLYIIPSLISFSSQIFKPNLVKKSWDSINLVLVLFALAFGFLGRNINNNSSNDGKPRFENGFDRSLSELSAGAPATTPPAVVQSQWYDFPEQPIGGGLRRHRSTSSYPDLRELTPPWNHRAGSPARFSDDTHLYSHRSLDSDGYYFRHRREQDLEIKDVIHVDPVVDLPKVVDSYSPPPPPSPPPAPPQPPPAAGKKKPSRIYQNVEEYDGERSTRSEFNEVLSPEVEPPAPAIQDSGERILESGIRKRGKGERRRARSSEPRKMVSPERSSPPWISPEIQDSGQNSGKVERKRTGANATKEFFTSFYQKKKKKRQRQRSVDNLDAFLHHPPPPPPVKFQLPPPSPPPPPPPLPPPPSSVLNNLFTSKKERRKKTSSTTPPPPPPAPSRTAARGLKGKPRVPLNLRYLNAIDDSSSGGESPMSRIPPPPPVPPPPRTAARGPKPTITRVSPFVTEKPRSPLNLSYLNGIIDDSSSGGESPVNRIPPPPPMPPFKMPDWKFAVEGNYVRVQSTLSSGSLSPDGDEAQSPSSSSSAVAPPLFCPSPDVDTKADSFIKRFRAGLKLEKINSFNQNQGFRMSNLGPKGL